MRDPKWLRSKWGRWGSDKGCPNYMTFLKTYFWFYVKVALHQFTAGQVTTRVKLSVTLTLPPKSAAGTHGGAFGDTCNANTRSTQHRVTRVLHPTVTLNQFPNKCNLKLPPKSPSISTQSNQVLNYWSPSIVGQCEHITQTTLNYHPWSSFRQHTVKQATVIFLMQYSAKVSL